MQRFSIFWFYQMKGSLNSSALHICRLAALPVRPRLSLASLTRRLIAKLALLFALAGQAVALNPELSIRQLVHNGWTGSRQGHSVSAVQAMAQSRDGYLWLGTDRGMVRFDGTVFSDERGPGPDALPRERITSIIGSQSGGLWIATRNGVAQWSEGRLTRYTPANGVPDGIVTAMTEDHTGSVWLATTSRGVARLAVIRNRTVVPVDWPAELPRGYITSLHEDASNQLWLGASGGVCRWLPGSAATCWLTNPQTPIEDVKSQPSGAVVLDGGSQTVRTFADGKWTPAAPALRGLKGRIKTLLADGDCLWIGTLGDGVLRSCNGSLERFTRRDGLTSDLVLSLFQDHEGNIWVGTSNGLDRFREPKVVRYSELEGLSQNVCTAVCPSRSGGVWVGTPGGGLDLVRGRSITHYGSLLRGATVLSLHEDGAGTLWVGANTGLFYRTATELRPVRSVGGQPLNRVTGLADLDGVLWVSDAVQGLVRIHDRRAARESRYEVPPGRNIFSLYVDRGGELCVGYFQGGMTIVNLADGRSTELKAELPGGAVQAIYRDPAGSLWVGTDQGLSRRRNGRWTTWDSRFGPIDAVQGIKTGSDGNLWVLTGGGLLQLNGDALAAIPDSAPSALPHRLFGPIDGIQFPASRRQVQPRLAQSLDGRLWASTDDGLAMIDPPRLRTNSIPPPVRIEQVLVDGKPVSSAAGTLAFRGRQIEFHFAILSLGVPEGVEILYRLEGFEDGWHNAAGITRVAYGQLRPKTYRFQVIAANSDGVWNREGADVVFQAIPQFYQTWAFQFLCACALGALVYSVHRIRMGLLRARLRVLLAERTRIARELHDTLLQGFAGTLYLLKAASLQMNSSPEEGMKGLQRAVQRGDQSLKEARQSLAYLRLTALEDQSLPEALDQACRQIVDGTSISFTMDSTGDVRPLPHEIEAALFIIGREAMNNAATHGKPGRIRVALAYQADRVILVVEDDGIGFNLDEGLSKKSHWGLTGIQERVQAFAGKLTIDAKEGIGARIEVTAPVGTMRTHQRRAKAM